MQSRSTIKFYLARAAWVLTAVVIFTLLLVGAHYTDRVLMAQYNGVPADVPVSENWESWPGLDALLVQVGVPVRPAVLLAIAFEIFSGLISVILGVLLFLRLLSPRHEHDRMALFTATMLITYGMLITNVTDVFGDGLEPWNTLYVLMGFVASVMFFLFVLTFPDGRYAPRWTVLIPWTTLAWMISWFFMPPLNPANWAPVYLNVSVMGLIVLAGAVQVYRYVRIYNPVQRQQTKWVAFVLVFMITAGVIQMVLDSDESLISRTGGTWTYLAILEQIVFNVLELLFPGTLFLVILHHRLWEVDRLINKALVYSLVTLLLVGLYLVVVVVLQGLFRVVAGQNSPLAVAASTLLIAAISNPARARVQDFVDRRFYRRQYDANQALIDFGALVGQETDLEKMSVRLRNVVQNTLQPDGVGLWLAPVRSPLPPGKRGSG